MFMHWKGSLFNRSTIEKLDGTSLYAIVPVSLMASRRNTMIFLKEEVDALERELGLRAVKAYVLNQTMATELCVVRTAVKVSAQAQSTHTAVLIATAVASPSALTLGSFS